MTQRKILKLLPKLESVTKKILVIGNFSEISTLLSILNWVYTIDLKDKTIFDSKTEMVKIATGGNPNYEIIFFKLDNRTAEEKAKNYRPYVDSADFIIVYNAAGKKIKNLLPKIKEEKLILIDPSQIHGDLIKSVIDKRLNQNSLKKITNVAVEEVQPKKDVISILLICSPELVEKFFLHFNEIPEYKRCRSKKASRQSFYKDRFHIHYQFLIYDEMINYNKRENQPDVIHVFDCMDITPLPTSITTLGEKVPIIFMNPFDQICMNNYCDTIKQTIPPQQLPKRKIHFDQSVTVTTFTETELLKAEAEQEPLNLIPKPKPKKIEKQQGLNNDQAENCSEENSQLDDEKEFLGFTLL